MPSSSEDSGADIRNVATIDEERSPIDTGRPTVSVVICTRNRPRSLEACVRSVIAQDVRPDEVIVVDDGELSRSDRRRLESICESGGVPFVYLRKEPTDRCPCLPASRNLAVHLAGGEIVQFLDDDVTLEAGFLREILLLYADDPARALIGTDGTLIEPASPNFGAKVFAWLYRLAGWWALKPRSQCSLPRPWCLRDRHRATPTLKIVGATMAFRRRVLQDTPFDEALTGYALGEDRDMAYRLSRQGWIARCQRALATHHHDVSQRPEPYYFGRMTVQNYGRIMSNSGLSQPGDWFVIAYSLGVIALAMLCFSLVRPRRYGPRFVGMVTGGVTLARDKLARRL